MQCARIPVLFLKTVLIAGAFWCPCRTTEARAEYAVDTGDVIDFSVAGVPTLQKNLTVDIDGEVSFPLVGRLRIAGSAIANIQGQVREIIRTKRLKLHRGDSLVDATSIEPDEISINIVQYRPVYVNGDVGKPGELTFRSGMTVHQAIALSGGYDLIRYRVTNPFIDSSDYRATYATLWSDYARASAQISRINTELERKKGVSREDLGSIPLPINAIDQIIDMETQKLQERNQQYGRDKSLQQRLLQSADERLNFLSERQKKERESAEIDATEIARLTDLSSRGLVPITRLVDQRRLSLIGANGALEVGARAEQARTDRETARRAIDSLDEKRRIELLNELQGATERLAVSRAKLQAVSEKILYTSAMRSKISRGPSANPTLVVTRTGPNGPSKLKAVEDTVLRPGDVVDVNLTIELDAVAER
jgi:polysaccharide export outer membrane protein